MKDNTTLVELLIDKTEKFGSSTIELAKLKLIRKSANVISFMVTQMLAVALLGMFFVFSNISLALWLGSITGNAYDGFLVISGCYLLLFVIISVFCRNSFRKYVKGYMINYLMK
ncbi:MAG: hypothetical protein EAY81_08930 [Bacteroidetes bacterium]|nr:MAG: hypothetical protein EAY81_08930 [Bacteroidota bacterium]